MFEKYVEIIKERLTEKRFIHSMNVADCARQIALKYGADPDKAYLGGLLHDICKNDSEENMLQIFVEFGIILDDIQKLSNKLWHSIAGAVYIEHKLGIKDKELLDAVRYHTTARADATLMDKILYIADYVSAERNFDGVEGLRKDLEKSLDLCYRNALQMSILELSQRLKPIHFDTFYAYNSSLME